MPETRLSPISRSLYEGSSVSVAEFVGSGHLGDMWPLNEHSHAAIQITISSRRTSMRADWLTDCGSKRQRQISGPALCITPAFQPHSMEWDEVRGTMMMMIAPDLLLEDNQSLTSPGFTDQERYGIYDPFLQHLGVLLLEARDTGMPITQLYAESTALILLRHLNRRVESLRLRQSAPCGRLQQVVEHIRTNLGTELSIVALARIAQTSPFHFARQFKVSTGLTPHQYVLEGRIERAKQLLANLQFSIADVAQACGFATQAHLTTVFRAHVGATPGTYRAHAVSVSRR
jgi:AraC family transcriptional regulator